MTQQRKQALSDLRIIEFGEMVAAPFCAKLLADLGAEVIKVERPERGDVARRYGPFKDGAPHPERSGFFAYLNTNKLGVTMSPAKSGGAEIFKKLVADADVLVESCPPGVMSRLGLDYASLKRINPRLVVTSITPFGQTGPYSGYRAFDLNVWHAGGIGYIWRERFLEEGPGPPLKGAGTIADFHTAASAAIATICAIFSRNSTRKGQHIDVSAQECVASCIGAAFANYQITGRVVGRATDTRSAMMQLLPCKDGSVQLTGREEFQWQALMDAMGNPEWSKDDWCQTKQGRADNADVLRLMMMEWTMAHTKDEIVKLAQNNRAPASKMADMRDVMADEHLRSRDFFVEADHPQVGVAEYPSAAYTFSETPWSIRKTAPLLGEHNEDIFSGRLKYTAKQLAELTEAGVI
ncbi:MAG: CoA transferase [SAR202 cluster bacterium]|nr:CoA transferase [SAR202 cluster bacterium]MDP6799609.1 CoA transferase [SAR202 cluster bacterium]